MPDSRVRIADFSKYLCKRSDGSLQLGFTVGLDLATHVRAEIGSVRAGPAMTTKISIETDYARGGVSWRDTHARNTLDECHSQFKF